MSGGYFDYGQFQMGDIAAQIEEVIRANDSTEKDEYGDDEYGDDVSWHWSPETVERFKEAEHTIRQAAEMVQRIDWLLSGDDGEDTFMTRWDEEVRGYY